MANNTTTLKTRVQMKTDTPENWNKAVNFTPLKGEIIVYDTGDIPLIKIGDGETLLQNLVFCNDYPTTAWVNAAISAALENIEISGGGGTASTAQKVKAGNFELEFNINETDNGLDITVYE